MFDQMDYHMDDEINHMMGVGTYSWVYIIIGIVIFLLFVLILLYILNYGQSKSNPSWTDKTVVDQKRSNSNEYDDQAKDKAFYCPNCGAKITDKTYSYCPNCGSQI